MHFTEADLLISDDEKRLLTRALASAAQPDPLTAMIAEKTALVDLVAAPYDLPELWLRGLVRALVLGELYAQAAPAAVPPHLATLHAHARQDLEDIRAGKYQALLKPGARPAAAPPRPAIAQWEFPFSRPR